MIVAPCFNVKRCACPQPFACTIPYGWRTHKTPSAYACTSFVSNLVLAKLELLANILANFTVCSITNWPHCAWARCHHYETESTLRKNRVHLVPFPVRDVVLIPGLLPIFLHHCEIKSGSGLGTRLMMAMQQTTLWISPHIMGAMGLHRSCTV